MAALALGLAGSAIGTSIGGTFLGVTAASWGFTAGSVLGSLLFAPNTDLPLREGPRLSDLKVQVSSYGAMIPFGYGTFRCAGNVIWSTPIQENATYTQVETGGKGGGGSSTQTQVSYYYTASCAVAFHDGEIVGIRKIWANGLLIYNVADVAGANTVLASSEFAASVRVYAGTEVQDPDALIQPFEGSGNVPAYRGTAYVVFQDIVLSRFSNRLPNFEFEVVSSNGTVSLGTAVYVNGTASSIYVPYSDTTISAAPLSGLVWLTYYDGQNYLGLLNLYTNSLVLQIPATSLGSTNGAVFGFGLYAIDGQGRAWGMGGGSSVKRVHVVRPDGGSHYFDTAVKIGGYGGVVSADYETFWATDNSGTGTIYRHTGIDYSAHDCVQTAVVGGTFSRFLRNALGISGRVYGINGSGRIAWVNTSTLAYHEWASIGSIDGTWGGIVGPDGYIYASINSNTLGKYTADGALVDSVAISNASGAMLYDSLGYVWVRTPTTLVKVQASTMEVVYTVASAAAGFNIVIGEFIAGVPVVYGTNANIYGRIGIVEPVARITITAVDLDDVVTDLCERGGLTASDIDVSSLAAEQLTGYVVSRRSPVRGMLEPLMMAKFFDAVESGGKVKFVKRGGASVRTIAEGRLAAREDEISESRDTLVLTRRQDLELPVQINLVYMDGENSYQVGEQASRRLLDGTIEPRTVELPLVLNASEAKSIVDTLLFMLWLARTVGSFTVAREQMAIEPTDVITIPYNGDDRVLRLTKKTEDPFSVLTFEAELEDSDIYTQDAPGASPPVPVDDIILTAPTDPVFMDLPLLRDADNNPGFYFAAKGVVDDWAGTVLYRSLDGGSSYDAVNNGTLVAPSVIGSALTALGNLTAHGNELIDEHNYVDVLVPEATLSGITRIQLFNGANAAVLLSADGPEIFQFRDATLIDTDTYRLTGLLRGRRGTESFMGGHVIGEIFVLLDNQVRAIPQSFAEINRDLYYKPVSVNSSLQRTAAVIFRNTGLRAKPLAPVHLGGGRNDDGDLLLEWTRRTRLEASLRDNVDAPIGESFERYVVEILSGADVVRTIPVTEQSLTYSAADQTTDFGSPQSSIDLVVYQVSEEFGRGYPAAATF